MTSGSKSAPNLLVICNDVLLPANSGGRIDAWRRLCVLHEQHQINLSLLCWYDAPRDGTPSKEAIEGLSNTFHKIKLVPIKRTFAEICARLFYLGRLPSHAASRWVTLDRNDLLEWATSCKPDAILLEGLYGGASAMWLSHQLQIPIIYRSHNIEHIYMKQQMQKSSGWKKKVGIFANLFGLKNFEKKVFQHANKVLDISFEDHLFWKKAGFNNVDWLAPIVDKLFVDSLGIKDQMTFDLLYFGNLNTPNNVDAIKWLLVEVLPLIQQPNLKVVIAGSKPSEEVKRLINATQYITLIENPADMAAIVRKAKIIVNPVHSGSGVNLKSVEMLFSHAYLISTSIGIKGLPEEAKQCFLIQDKPQEFANAISNALNNDVEIDLNSRVYAQQLFSSDSIEKKLLPIIFQQGRHFESL